MTTISNAQKIQEVINRAWSDESLKTKLLNNPKSVLSEFGLEFPSSTEVQVHENGPGLINYVLPQANEIPPGVDFEKVEPVVVGKVIKRALADDAFKTELLSNPKSAIAKATSATLPKSMDIQVYEETPTIKHLVLPVNPANSELSDADLELVAGGKASDAEQKQICDAVTTGATIGCGITAFTTPVAGVITLAGAGASTGASVIASNT